MKVGLTYDLRSEYLREGYSEEETAELDSPVTVEALEQTLQSLGFATERIGHIRNLTQRLACGHRWDLVFNIAEGLHGLGRESAVPALLDAYRIPYTFSDPLVLALSLHKGMTKRIIRDLGIPTTEFAVVHDEREAEAVDLAFPLFAKPVAEGTGKGINAGSRIEDRRQLAERCRFLLARFRQPVLVERFLPGREFTVGIIGTGAEAEAVAVMEVILNANAEKDAYSYLNKEECDQRVEYRLVRDAAGAEAAEVALRAWRGLGCRDGGRLDLRADERGRPSFMEVNPLAGLHPQHSDLPILCRLAGVEYRELVERIVRSALRRTGLEFPV